ncbi:MULTISPECIES: LacI family DNA-binding transcriptional regulator [unclassified Cellvibrio]|uniref:LacI family DNA-binding transcriptional regulator n=1 Tax=unclassified Cellvibrio TaxID=2624793 RepID=UPI000780AFB7|nr:MULTISPECIES: LacI family DNA-binding transcriptional regulator [unclassified Cellvibrio]QEY17026.1 LacI family DNA-binding transcriptional regulator [Cellvibrio sp. KY-GH-1]
MSGRRSPEKNKQSTMRDVAEMANVSLMTVSRVLNEDGKVADETRERVMAAVEKLNYKLNISARSLSSAKSYEIGFFYDQSKGAFIKEYLIGTMLRCNQLGYHLILEPCDFSDMDINSHIKKMVRRHALDGIIVPPPLSDNAKLLDALDAEGLRYVRVGPGAQLKRAFCVHINDYAAAVQMTEHLINKGHKNIGFIKGDLSQETSHRRFAGYMDTMQKHNLRVASSWIGEGNFEFEGGMLAAEKILKKTKVSAIFASNDDMAAGVIAAARKMHIDVPEQLSVAGFDDTTLAESMWPKLTTIHQPIYEMSQSAVDLLVESIRSNFDKKITSKVQIELDHYLKDRESINEIH